MRRIALALALAWVACGGGQPPPPQPAGGSDPAFHDTRTAIEKRRDTACEQLGQRNTACAVADARQNLAKGVDPNGHAYSKDMFDRDTAAAVQAKNTEVFVDKCKKQHLNSYQVRVYEVCMREETECDPMLACLQHVHDPAPGAP
jgi:hypothetical protein